ncbi:hypothetical protein B0H11DRAFT_469249 [Mycena galericulata]|nr:hypothetical protein B0H11DRAFT_469249 [Mycena galericulata]
MRQLQSKQFVAFVSAAPFLPLLLSRLVSPHPAIGSFQFFSSAFPWLLLPLLRPIHLSFLSENLGADKNTMHGRNLKIMHPIETRTGNAVHADTIFLFLPSRTAYHSFILAAQTRGSPDPPPSRHLMFNNNTDFQLHDSTLYNVARVVNLQTPFFRCASLFLASALFRAF